MVNIFCTSKSAVISARNLPDLLTGRMCLETAQVLCGAVQNLNNSKIQPPYNRSAGQRKHPSIIWAGADRQHFVWLLRHFKALNDEYKLRYSKDTDYTSFTKCYAFLKSCVDLFPAKADYEMQFATTITQIALLQPHWSVHKKYRYAMVHKFYYLYERQPTWKNCDPPDFLFDPVILAYFRKRLGKPIRKLRK